MKNLIRICLLITSVFIFTGCDSFDESPFELDIIPDIVQVNDYDIKYIYKYTVTSLTDNLVIKNVIINKGKCKVKVSKKRITNNGTSPVLNYSDIWKFSSITDEDGMKCRPLDVEIQTNQGDWFFDGY